MTCRITVNDGINAPVVLEGIPELGIGFGTVGGGGDIIRFLGGGAKKQQRWRKETYTITGRGRMPSGLRDLTYGPDVVLTITVETNLGADVYTTVSLGPSEDWSLTGGTVSWTLVAEAD